MNELTARMKEFWESVKDTYPIGQQITASDDLAAFFMEEGPRLEYGDDLDIPEIAEAADTYNTPDLFGIDDLNNYEPDEELVSTEADEIPA